MRGIAVKIVALLVVAIFVLAIVQRHRQDKKDAIAALAQKPPPVVQTPPQIDVADRLVPAYEARGAGKTAEARVSFQALLAGRTDLVPGLPDESTMTFADDSPFAIVHPPTGDATYAMTRTGRVTVATKGETIAMGGVLLAETPEGVDVRDPWTGQLFGTVPGMPVAAQRDGAFVVYAPRDAEHTLRIWVTHRAEDTRSLTLSSLPNHDHVVALPSGAVADEGDPRITDRIAAAQTTLSENERPFARISRDGHWLAATFRYGDAQIVSTLQSVAFWDLRTGRMVTALRTFHGADGAFSPDGNRAFFVASVREEDDDVGAVAVVDLPTGRVLSLLKDCGALGTAELPTVTPSASGRWLAVADAARVCLYDARTLHLVWRTAKSTDDEDADIRARVAFAMDEKVLVIQSLDGLAIEARRTADGAALASGAPFALVPAGAQTAMADSLRITHDHVFFALTSQNAPARLFSVGPSLVPTTRPLTKEETAVEKVPPELVPVADVSYDAIIHVTDSHTPGATPMPNEVVNNDDHTLQSDDARRGELLARARNTVCSAGEIVVPSEYCAP